MIKLTKIVLLCVSITLLLMCGNVTAGQCNVLFPDGASTHSATGTIAFDYNARLIGSDDNLLATKSTSKNGGSSVNTCNTSDCVATGNPSEPASAISFQTTTSTQGVTIGYQGSIVLGSGSFPGNEFGDINPGSASEASITFANTHSEYFVDRLVLGFKNTLHLKAGTTYWFNQLTLGSQANIIVTGTGSAIIYVNQNLSLQSPSLINSPSINGSGDASKLVMHVFSNVTFDYNSTFTGSLYVSGNLILGSASYIFGAVSAANIQLGTNSTITYQSAEIADTDFGNICELPPPPQCEITAGSLNAVGIRIGSGGSNTQINSTTEALAIHAAWLAAGSPASGLIDSGTYNVVASGATTVDRIDFGGSGGDFAGTVPYPGVSGNDFLVHTSGTLSLPAGDYTIFVESDDGFSFVMNTLSGDTVSFNKFGGSTAGENNELRFETPTANSNTGGSFTLSQDSVFEISAIFFERAGGDFMEISIANDILASVAPSGYEILRNGAINAKVKFGECPGLTPKLAFYQFEENSWSGSGSVIDSSDNAHHGSPLGSITPVLPTDSQKSCQAMDVSYNSSFFYTSALNTRLDVDSDIGQAGTVSFWYRSKASWGSSYARQLLDASNGFLFLFGKSFYLTLYSGKLEFGMEDSSDRDAVLRASGLNYAANQWVHVAISWDLSADSMAIFVNGVAVATTTNAGLNGTMPNLNTLYVGDSRDLYFTGNSSDNSAYGQFDDVRIYQLAQSAADVAADANNLSPCQTTTVDHFRLEHDTQGFTCESERIVLKACKDSNCTQLYDLPTSISLAPGSWNGGSTLNFTGSVAADLSITSAGTYAFTKTSASENAGLRCFFGATETCNIEFVDAGFEFIGATVNDKILPDQLAETSFSNVQLRSVQDNNGVCQAALTGNKSITLSYNCDSPDVCLTPLAGIPLTNPSGENSGNIVLNFGSNGIASLGTLSYADAGRLILSAQANIDGATLLKGSSLVDIYPAALRLDASPASVFYTGAGDTDHYIAGQPFELSIAALGAAGGLLPNYQAQQLQLKVKRLYPVASGSVDGNLRYAVAGELGSSVDADLFFDVGNLTFSGGRYQYSAAYYDEVGRIAIDVQDANYLGNNIASVSELALGQFIPAYYTVTAESPSPALQNVQNNFTYVGQTIPFYSFPAMKITAKNALDQITNNHDSGDWSLRPTLSDVNSALNYIDKSAYPGDATVFKGNAPIISGDDNYDGSVLIVVPDASIVYNKTDPEYNRIAEIDPFAAWLDIVFDAEFFTDSNGLCFRDNYLDASCNDFTFVDVGGADLRFGRFALKSSYGPEDEPLTPEFAAQYYVQGKWLVNTLDDGATATSIDFSQSANQLLVVKKGDGNDLTSSIDPVFSNGRLLQGLPDQQQDFQLSAPGITGEVFLRLNPAADPSGWPLYLNYDWNGDGKICNQAAVCGSGYDIDYPQAALSFGLFRGNDRVIQWREVFN